jgi:hypothetical protein
MASASFTLRAVDQTRAAFDSVRNNLSRLNNTAQVAGKSLTKSLDLRGAMNAVAIAVGLSVDNIADKVARLVSGTSAEQELLASEAISLQQKLAQLRNKNAEDRLSDEQLLLKLERDRERLVTKVSAKGEGSGTKEFNEALENQIALEEVIARIGSERIRIQNESKTTTEAYQKSLNDLSKAQSAVYSGKTVSIEERILGLRAQEAAIMRKIAGVDINDTERRIELNNELTAVLMQMAPLLAEQSRLAREAGDIIASSFEDAILSGEKLRDTMRALAQDLIRLLFRQQITEPLAKNVGSFFTGLFAGRATGGPVTGNTPYIVGERGPELFVPTSSGNIISNAAMRSGNGAPAMGGVTVNYNIAAGVTRGELLPILEAERKRLKAEIPDMVRRGGSYRAAFA